ncbi:MAG TPA: hypothetical protein VMW72_10110 [Sedimentisphaerales bacterium]|nr:hypothetical protein [Sedimentisphaerales bacterium]
MNALLAQLVQLARGNGVEGWMDILVLVLVAAVYGLGTIIKAKKGKKVQEQSEEQQKRKPASSRGVLEQFVREIQRALDPTEKRESRPSAQSVRQRIAHPHPHPVPVVRKYAAEAKQAPRTQPITPPVKPKRPGLELSIPAPQVQPAFEELSELQTSIQALPEFTSKTVEGLVGKREGMDEVVESKYLSEVLLDYADPDELRMAILHYEILGMPLSLRGPSGQIIGL